jgi:N-acetylmuramoyl-L-alanine amidase
MQIKKHKVEGPGIKYVESPNTSGEFQQGALDTIVLHYTAGRDAESSVRTLTDPTVKASAHIVVGRDGSITQLVPFNAIAWHAGQSSYEGRIGFNKYSIGIEIDNAGLLTKNGNTYSSWFGRIYDEPEVVAGIHRNESVVKFWHRYTEEQITIVEDLCRLLVKEYDLKFILGHEEISPHRKIDPGPAFPLDKLREKILSPGRDEDEPDTQKFPKNGSVTASKLNIRKGPGRNNRSISDPLLKGQNIKVLEQAGDWYRVSVEVQGWVSKEYVDLKPE